MTVRVQRWDNGLGVRIPRDVARASAIREGAELDISVNKGRVVLTPVKPPTLSELVARMKAEDRPELVDWGPPTGREAW